MLKFMLEVVAVRSGRVNRQNHLGALRTKVHIPNSRCMSIELWRRSKNCRSPYSYSSVRTCRCHQVTTRRPIDTIHCIAVTTEFIAPNWTIQVPQMYRTVQWRWSNFIGCRMKSNVRDGLWTMESWGYWKQKLLGRNILTSRCPLQWLINWGSIIFVIKKLTTIA